MVLAVLSNALRRNLPEWAAAFDYIQSVKSSVPNGLIQGRTVAEMGPTSQQLETKLKNDGEPDVDCYAKTLNHRKILRKTQKKQPIENLKNT